MCAHTHLPMKPLCMLSLERKWKKRREKGDGGLNNVLRASRAYYTRMGHVVPPSPQTCGKYLNQTSTHPVHLIERSVQDGKTAASRTRRLAGRAAFPKIDFAALQGVILGGAVSRNIV